MVTLTPLTIVQNESLLLPLLHNASIFILVHIIKHSPRGFQLRLLVHSSLSTAPGVGRGGGGRRGEEEGGREEEEGGRKGGRKGGGRRF